MGDVRGNDALPKFVRIREADLLTSRELLLLPQAVLQAVGLLSKSLVLPRDGDPPCLRRNDPTPMLGDRLPDRGCLMERQDEQPACCVRASRFDSHAPLHASRPPLA